MDELRAGIKFLQEICLWLFILTKTNSQYFAVVIFAYFCEKM
jgi:hypothetical protein